MIISKFSVSMIDYRLPSMVILWV